MGKDGYSMLFHAARCLVGEERCVQVDLLFHRHVVRRLQHECDCNLGVFFVSREMCELALLFKHFL